MLENRTPRDLARSLCCRDDGVAVWPSGHWALSVERQPIKAPLTHAVLRGWSSHYGRTYPCQSSPIAVIAGPAFESIAQSWQFTRSEPAATVDVFDATDIALPGETHGSDDESGKKRVG